MREGMQIESDTIPVERKIELLDALSDTGLRRIVVGSFVSPKWTPQMRDIDTLVERFTPRPGVTYLAIALNDRGRERAARHSPPLSVDNEHPGLSVDMCDVFARRNANRTQAEGLARWPAIVEEASRAGRRAGAVRLNAAWGSNWAGEFTLDSRLAYIAQAHELWSAADIPVTRLFLGDPMGWALPQDVGRTLTEVRARWPSIREFHLHLHDQRGLAMATVFETLRVLDAGDTLFLDTSVGGMAGCPYCGNGRAASNIATEDLVHFLEESGVETGIDLNRLIDVVVLAEEIVGHRLFGHVSKAGRRPHGDRLFPADLPCIETLEEAAHFRLGPAVHAHQKRPWN